MSSNKNILQEFCQKNKYKTPEYSAKSKGLAHEPKWYCTIKLTDLNLEMKTKKSCKTKIEAEQAAAKLVLNKLNDDKPPENPIQKLVIETVYLIDLENKPMFNNEKFIESAIYIGFHNSIHHSLPKYTEWHICKTEHIENELKNGNNKLIYLISGGVKDLVDHFMSMFSIPLIFYLKNKTIKNIFIVSGDNSGFCTKACLEKAMIWYGINGITIENVSKL